MDIKSEGDKFLIKLTAMACIGGFLFGLDFS